MKHLLLIHTSLNGAKSLSSSLALEAAASWTRAHPESHIETLDFAETPIPHLTADTFGAFVTPDAERSDEQRTRVALSDRLVEQLKAADDIILAVPMYNFGVPSQLRAYFDHVARAGVTFRYTSDGPVGLLDDKRVTVIATRGGQYEGTPLDNQTKYLEQFLGFLGLDNVRFVYAEGTAMGDEALDTAVQSARASIHALHD
ncbi:MAG: NAD(P)H-dependent oxidoreductase [Pseudomonadota bacterium]